MFAGIGFGAPSHDRRRPPGFEFYWARHPGQDETTAMWDDVAVRRSTSRALGAPWTHGRPDAESSRGQSLREVLREVKPYLAVQPALRGERGQRQRGGVTSGRGSGWLGILYDLARRMDARPERRAAYIEAAVRLHREGATPSSIAVQLGIARSSTVLLRDGCEADFRSRATRRRGGSTKRRRPRDEVEAARQEIAAKAAGERRAGRAAKMRRSEILEARRLWATGEWRIVDLADVFDLSPEAMSAIVHGRSFQDVA